MGGITTPSSASRHAGRHRARADATDLGVMGAAGDVAEDAPPSSKTGVTTVTSGR